MLRKAEFGRHFSHLIERSQNFPAFTICWASPAYHAAMMVNGVFRVLALLFAMMAILGAASPANAQAGLVGQPITVCVTRAAPGMTAAALFRAPGVFRCGGTQNALGPGDYWVRSKPLRIEGPRSIRTLSLWQERVTLYARYADGAVFRESLDGHGVTRHLQLGSIVAQALPERRVPVVQLLWHVEGAQNTRGILMSPRIVTAEQNAGSNAAMGALYAAFGGLSLALLIYNLAMWGALRHRFQLAYCAMVAALMIYAYASSGALAWGWPTLDNTDRIRINYLTLGLSAAAAMAFARSFFEPRVFAGAIGRLVTFASTWMLLGSLLFAVAAPWHFALLDRLYCMGFLWLILAIIPVMWRAWRVGSTYMWVFAIAWAAPIVMAGVRLATSLGLLPYNFWVDNSTILSMTVEALLSSLAIAYRMHLLSLERDEARANEIAARLLADTDSLTGLLNRRAFLHQAIGREGEHILMIADLDHFKRVNETIGHDGGDEVLRVFARTLRQALPPEALVARIGGEEFAIVLPNSVTVDPGEILARLRAGRMPYDVSVTASIGTCSGPLLRETDWKALYACADRALFEAKSAGRDRARGRALPDRMAA